MKQKSFKSTYILVTVFLVLLSYLFISHYAQKKEKEERANMKIFENFDENQVSIIKIKNSEKEIVIEKKENRWQLPAINNYPADQKIISDMIDSVKDLQSSSSVSENPEKQARFNLTENQALSVDFMKDANTNLAGLYIGKKGPSFSSQYIRLKNSNNILLVSKNLENIFDKDIQDFRDKTIMSFDPALVLQIVLKSENGKITFVKENDTWKSEDIENIDSAKAEDLASLLADLQADGFKTQDNGKNDNTEEGKEKIKIFISLKDNISYTLYIGESDKEYFARLEGNNTIFKISSYIVNQFMRDKNEYQKIEDTEEVNGNE